MFAILVLISIYFTIDCHSICETIKPNDVFKGLQIYRKFESYSESHLVMNNRNGTLWEFDITSDGQFSHKMDVSMDTTNDSSLQSFGIIAFDNSYRNCMLFAETESLLRLKCEPKNVSTPNWVKRDDYVIVPKPPETGGHLRLSVVLFFNPKTKDIVYVYVTFDGALHPCSTEKSNICGRNHPLFVQQMDKTLFNSIEGVVDFKSSDGKTNYFILFKIDGRPKFCVTSADEPISLKCNSSEELTNLFGECFETSRTDSSDTLFNETTEDTTEGIGKRHQINSTLVWVLIVVVLLVVIILIVFGIVFLRRRRSEEITEMSSFHMVSSNPTLKSKN